MERWKPIPKFDDLYEVSSLGRIRALKTGRIKKPTVDSESGRHFVLLWRGNKPKLMRLSRAVLLAFRGAPPLGHEGCHNDGKLENNTLDNLRWDTAKNNQADRIKHGTSNRGEKSQMAKITEKQALAIIRDPRKQAEIAAAYKIKQGTVSRIKSGIRWPHLQDP